MGLLDLFCGAGGAAMGYFRAGFKDITGIDNRPMPRYPFKFLQADALEYLAEHGHEYDVIHASPPCQAYSRITGKHRVNHNDLIQDTRELLEEIGKPYIIENVEGAPMQPYTVLLCGSMFGLNVRRHRLFESPILILSPGGCNHRTQMGSFYSLCWKNRQAGKLSPVVGVYGNVNYAGEFGLRCQAMGIYWMVNSELTQAIPPAYTEYIGKRILEAIA